MTVQEINEAVVELRNAFPDELDGLSDDQFVVAHEFGLYVRAQDEESNYDARLVKNDQMNIYKNNKIVRTLAKKIRSGVVNWVTTARYEY